MWLIASSRAALAIPTAMAQMWQPGEIEKSHQVPETVTELPHKIGSRDSHIRKRDLRRVIGTDAQFPVELVGLKPLPVGLHNKEGMSLVPVRIVRIRETKDIHVLCDRSIGNEHLGAVDHPLVLVLYSTGDGACHIRACIGFGDRASHDRLASHQGRKVLLLLLLCPEEIEEFRTEGRRDHGIPHARIHGPEFFRDQAVLEKSESGPLILFVDENAHKSEFASLTPDTQIKGLVPVKLPGFFREKFAYGKFPGRLLNVSLFFAESEIHKCPPITPSKCPVAFQHSTNREYFRLD